MAIYLLSRQETKRRPQAPSIKSNYGKNAYQYLEKYKDVYNANLI